MNVCEDDLIFQEHFITFHEKDGRSLLVLIKNLLRIHNYISTNARPRTMIMAGISEGKKILKRVCVRKITRIFLSCGSHFLNLDVS